MTSVFSVHFLAFFLVIFCLVRLAPRRRTGILLIASVIFLLSLQPYLLLVHLGAALLAFFCGRWMASRPNQALVWLTIGLTLELTILFAIKFVRPWRVPVMSYTEVLKGYDLHLSIPLGISFSVLMACGYLIDVYRLKQAPEISFRRFLVFTSYFLHIILGPISRYREFTQQLDVRSKLTRQDVLFAAYEISLGFFKRTVIVNHLAPVYLRSLSSDQIENQYGLWFAIEIGLGFMQLYCDFSSHIDVVRGLSRLLGIELPRNFNRPYMSQNPLEIWNRWHMSFTTWIKDYIYFPLLLKTRNVGLSVFVLFICLGAFHEISFRFLAWACMWTMIALAYSAYVKHLKVRWLVLRSQNSLVRAVKITLTFTLVSMTAVLTWADSLSRLSLILHQALQPRLGSSELLNLGPFHLTVILAGLLLMVIQEQACDRRSRASWLYAVLALNLLISVVFGSFDEYPLMYANFN